MSNIFGKLTAALGPRLVGTIVSAAAGSAASWIFVHSKGAVSIDPEQVVAIGTAMIGSYAATHRLISAKTNPGDAPSGTMKDADKEAMKTGEPVTPAVTPRGE